MDQQMKNTNNSKSIYTFQTEETPNPDPSYNQIHHLYTSLMSNLSDQYPFLSKVVYLCLVLGTSTIIYTPNPDQVQDIYRRMCSHLRIKQRIYNCDTNTFSTDIFRNKPKEDLYLLSNLLDVDNKKANQMREHIGQNTVIDLETPERKQGNCLGKQFSMLLIDTSTDNFKEFIRLIDQRPKSDKIDSKAFNEVLTKNRKMAEQMANSGFVRAYLEAFQLLLTKNHIKFPHSRWKKAYEFIKVIGLNKTENQYKSLCLVDCIFVPWFLSTSEEQYCRLSAINAEVVTRLSVYYGTYKFIRHLDRHFFLPEDVRKQYSDKVLPLINRPSFFFPCVKYPDLVSLQVEEQQKENIQFFYQVLGQRKLMSDRYLEIGPSKKYSLTLQMKSNVQMQVEVGIACYDKGKQLICSKTNYQKQGTQVIIKQVQGQEIVVDPSSVHHLANWNTYKEESSLEQKLGCNFCMGVFAGNKIQPQYVLKSKSLGEASLSNCGYEKIDTESGKITLSQHLVAPFKYMMQNGAIVLNKTKLANYINYPVYKVSKVAPAKKWQPVTIFYSKESKVNSLEEQGIRYVRVIVIVQQHLSGKTQKILHLRNIEFSPLLS